MSNEISLKIEYPVVLQKERRQDLISCPGRDANYDVNGSIKKSIGSKITLVLLIVTFELIQYVMYIISIYVIISKLFV